MSPTPKLGETRTLQLTIPDQDDGREVALDSRGVYQSTNANIWIPNDKQYHEKSQTTHNDGTCKLRLLTAEGLTVPTMIAEKYDLWKKKWW